MLPRWPNLSERERHAYQVACAFLVDRLEERSTIDWALRFKARETCREACRLGRSASSAPPTPYRTLAIGMALDRGILALYGRIGFELG